MFQLFFALQLFHFRVAMVWMLFVHLMFQQFPLTRESLRCLLLVPPLQPCLRPWLDGSGLNVLSNETGEIGDLVPTLE